MTVPDLRIIADEAPPRAPRRNDVAFDRRERGFASYGRISRIEGGVAIIVNARDGILEVPLEHVGIDIGYKGLETWGPVYEVDGVAYRDLHLRRMPSLRRLKQFVSHREGRIVWARERRRLARAAARG